MFLLQVEFWPREKNGNVSWSSAPILLEHSFGDDEFDIAKHAFMELGAHQQANGNLTPCNLRGKLLDDNGVVCEAGVGGWVKRWCWDWTKEEQKEEWSRSEACRKWLDFVGAIQSIKVNVGRSVIDVLVDVGWCSSKGVARRKIEEGAVKIDKVKMFDVGACVERDCLLSLGKRDKIEVKVK
jgi:hypothetical protein